MAKETKTRKTTTTKKSAAPKKTQATSKTTTTKKKEMKVIQTENSYGRTILAAILIIVVLIGGYLSVQYKKNHSETSYVQTNDERKFTDEYESLNGVENNKSITILKDNNIKYISLEEANEILENGSGVIYFGFASCPWCRNAVPVLLDAMTNTGLDTIYYVDLRPDNKKDNDLRDEYTLDAKNKAKKTKDASDSYYDILLSLANYLSEYKLTTEKGKSVSTGEKRLYAPTVVAVKDGVVVGFHEGTVEGHEEDADGKLSDLTEDQTKQLLNDYTNLIEKYQDDKCIEEDGC